MQSRKKKISDSVDYDFYNSLISRYAKYSVHASTMKREGKMWQKEEKNKKKFHSWKHRHAYVQFCEANERVHMAVLYVHNFPCWQPIFIFNAVC